MPICLFGAKDKKHTFYYFKTLRGGGPQILSFHKRQSFATGVHFCVEKWKQYCFFPLPVVRRLAPAGLVKERANSCLTLRLGCMALPKCAKTMDANIIINWSIMYL